MGSAGDIHRNIKWFIMQFDSLFAFYQYSCYCTLMVVAKATETCRCLIIYIKESFTSVRLLVHYIHVNIPEHDNFFVQF